MYMRMMRGHEHDNDEGRGQEHYNNTRARNYGATLTGRNAGLLLDAKLAGFQSAGHQEVEEAHIGHCPLSDGLRGPAALLIRREEKV